MVPGCPSRAACLCPHPRHMISMQRQGFFSSTEYHMHRMYKIEPVPYHTRTKILESSRYTYNSRPDSIRLASASRKSTTTPGTGQQVQEAFLCVTHFPNIPSYHMYLVLQSINCTRLLLLCSCDFYQHTLMVGQCTAGRRSWVGRGAILAAFSCRAWRRAFFLAGCKSHHATVKEKHE